MNWIEKMIVEQCPNGVVWEKIDKICKTKTPPFKLKTNEYQEQGAFHIIDQGQKLIAGYTDNKDALVEDGEYILYGDHTCIVKYYNGCFAQGADGLKILESLSNNSKYVYYALCVYNLSSTEYKRHWAQAKKISIPLPPLSIQKEIVSVLDKFSELIEKTDEEIALRQKQYEYYREKLLTFEKGEVEMVKISSFTKILRGKRLTKKQLSESEKYPVYHGGQEPIGYYSDYNRDANTVMVINVGASAGTVGYCDRDFWSSDGCFCLEKNPNVNDKYLYVALLGKEVAIKAKVRHAGIPTLDQNVIERLELPIPSPSRQQSIVATLDKFEALISKLKEERELRQKQYEYYREKLLTF